MKNKDLFRVYVIDFVHHVNMKTLITNDIILKVKLRDIEFKIIVHGVDGHQNVVFFINLFIFI